MIAMLDKSYQDIPTRPDIPFHRGRTEQRASRICEIVNVRGQDVLDLGCSVGTMLNYFAKQGARKIVGIDNDRDSIELGRSVYPNVEFIEAEIDKDFIKNMDHFDVVVWVSQFMWMANKYGMDYALDCLWTLSKKCDVLVFETAGKDDGSAPLDMRQEDVFKMLCKNTCFQDITDHGPWNDGWSPRNVFVCKSPFKGHAGEWSSVELFGRNVRKVFKDNPFSRELKKRESESLRLLYGPNVPAILDEDELSITMDWCGIKAKWISDIDLQDILHSLEMAGITHRDIRPENILWNGDNLILIDFSFSTIGDEVTNYHYDLGGKYKCPYGFNDEYSFKKVQEELISCA